MNDEGLFDCKVLLFGKNDSSRQWLEFDCTTLNK